MTILDKTLSMENSSWGLGAAELILLLIAVTYWGLIIFSLVDILRSNFKDATTKLIWVVAVIFAPFIGSIIYLTIGRKEKIV